MTFEKLTQANFPRYLQDNPLCVAYFSAPGCAVCTQLKPKVYELLQTEFPLMGAGEVDCEAEKALAASHVVFAIPTLLVFIEGRETQRFSRSFSPLQVAAELQRPYRLCFGR